MMGVIKGGDTFSRLKKIGWENLNLKWGKITVLELNLGNRPGQGKTLECVE